MSNDQSPGEKVIVDRGDAIPPSEEIPTQDFLKAMHDFTEVCRESNKTMQNKLEAYENLEKERAKNYVIDHTPTFDSRDATCISDITEREPITDWDNEVCKANNRLYYEMELRKIFASWTRTPVPDWSECINAKPYERILRSGPARVRADIWNPGTTLEGQEWAPIGVASSVIDLFRVATAVVSRFPRVDMGTGTRRMDFPVISAASGAVDVGTTSAGSTAATVGGESIDGPTPNILILDPARHDSAYVSTSMEQVEDSVVNTVDTLAMELRVQMAEAHEIAVLSAQTAGTMDDATNGQEPADGYAAAGANAGLRFYALSTNSFTVNVGGLAFDLAKFEECWSQLGNFGGNPANISFFTPVKVMIDLMSDSAVRSMNTMGPTGTLPTGTIGFVHGIAIIPTGQIPLTDTTGVVHATAGNNTQQSAVMVNTTRWRVGFKRNVEVIIEDRRIKQEILLKAYARHAIGHAPPETDTHTVVAIDIAP